MSSINPNYRAKQKPHTPEVDAWAKGILNGDRAALSQAITAVESNNPNHRKQVEQLMPLVLSKGSEAIRIGISGVPGVGKSTFIEAFGKHLLEAGHKLAVLAVDPSSAKNKGSILGDKTRMQTLAAHPNAFIRPSPSAGNLGGVARNSRECIALCEAAGYDVILVETVGVGQSEIAVRHMTDFFLLLMLAGAGDELQGIKRGIMEMADLLLINKADGENQQAAKRAAAEYKRALHLFPPNENEWIPEVKLVSALEQRGITEVWDCIQRFERQQKLKGYFAENRKAQNLHWFEEALGDLLLRELHSQRTEELKSMKAAVEAAKIEPHAAAQKLIREWFAQS